MEFANRSGINVISSYIDSALSAKTDNRPEFQRMIKDSYKHLFDVILVWKLDRFARNRYDSAHYKNLLKRNGVRVISAKESVSEGSEGILLESMLEGMAEYYSAELSEKVKRGLKENALKAKVNGGQVPFGYFINAEQKLEIDEKYAPIVEEIFTLYSEDKGIKEIVDMLNVRSIRTKFDRPMSINIVQYMLSNRKYLGEYKYLDIIIQDGAPAIISEDLFERVQERLRKNKKAPARHKAEDDYILTTKLFCGKCGAYMIGESGTGRNGVHHYYKCAKAKKHKTCDKKTVKKDWIEEKVLAKAVEILNDEKLVALLVDRLYELQAAGSSRIPKLQAQLDEAEVRIKNIISAIEQGIITDSTKERLDELETHKKELEISILQEQIKKPFLTKEQIQFGIEKFKKLDLATKEGKQRMIDGFVNAIYLSDDEITYTFNYRDGTYTVSLSDLEQSSGSDNKLLGAPSQYDPSRIIVHSDRFGFTFND
jgi:DNA invertase Pin-like site-specific DNA recombinase